MSQLKSAGKQEYNFKVGANLSQEAITSITL